MGYIEKSDLYKIDDIEGFIKEILEFLTGYKKKYFNIFQRYKKLSK